MGSASSWNGECPESADGARLLRASKPQLPLFGYLISKDGCYVRLTIRRGGYRLMFFGLREDAASIEERTMRFNFVIVKNVVAGAGMFGLVGMMLAEQSMSLTWLPRLSVWTWGTFGAIVGILIGYAIGWSQNRRLEVFEKLAKDRKMKPCRGSKTFRDTIADTMKFSDDTTTRFADAYKLETKKATFVVADLFHQTYGMHRKEKGSTQTIAMLRLNKDVLPSFQMQRSIFANPWRVEGTDREVAREFIDGPLPGIHVSSSVSRIYVHPNAVLVSWNPRLVRTKQLEHFFDHSRELCVAVFNGLVAMKRKADLRV